MSFAMEMDVQTAMQLLQRVSCADQAAFTLIHRAMARRIFAFALQRLRDENRAEEVVVDTLHEVWKHPLRYDGRCKLSTWVLGIARNRVLTVLRSSDRATDPASDELLGALPDESPTAFDQVAHRQREHGVQECMAKLSAEHRECMHLVFFEGLGLAEVAQVQACPENTVKTRLFHARRRIQNCLQRLLDREGRQAEGVNGHA